MMKTNVLIGRHTLSGRQSDENLIKAIANGSDATTTDAGMGSRNMRRDATILACRPTSGSNRSATKDCSALRDLGATRGLN
jgi:hypothetical protein